MSEADALADEQPAEDMPPVPVRRGIFHYAKITVYMIIVVVVSLAVGGAWPESYRTIASLTQSDAPAEQPLDGQGMDGRWKSLSGYVMEQKLLEQMTLQERIKHEAEQRALLTMREDASAKIPKLNIPLLPGPVVSAQTPETAKVADPLHVLRTTAVPDIQPAAEEKVIVQPAAVKKVDPFMQDMATLEALQAALRELNAEKDVKTGTYRDDIADR